METILCRRGNVEERGLGHRDKATIYLFVSMRSSHPRIPKEDCRRTKPMRSCTGQKLNN